MTPFTKRAVSLFWRTLLAIALILLIHLLGACSNAPQRFSPPSVAPVREKTDQAKAHVAQAQTHAAAAKENLALAMKLAPSDADPQLVLNLGDAAKHIDALITELVETQAALKEAGEQITILQGKVDKQTEQLNTAVVQRDAAVHKYHLLKFYFCAIAAAAVFLLLFRFKLLLALVPPPYNLVALGAGPALTFGFLWLRL